MGGRRLSSYTEEELKKHREEQRLRDLCRRRAYYRTEKFKKSRKEYEARYRAKYPDVVERRKRTAQARRVGGIVFICAKCGALASSKNHSQTLCKKCRPKKTIEDRRRWQREYYLTHYEHMRAYNQAYRRLGQTESKCDLCGRVFWDFGKQQYCKYCRKKPFLKVDKEPEK